MPYPAISQSGSAQRPSAPPDRGPARAPLSLRQLAALAAIASRELCWCTRTVSREVAQWRALASNIPDDALRHDALNAIARKRANIDGAALFATLPRARSNDLLRLLVAYEILADFLDSTNERAADAGVINGLQLHRALRDALDPTALIGDYYRHHPWQRDGGYVQALVDTCQELCQHLPSFDAAMPHITRAASMTDVLALNHETDPDRREQALRTWADTHCSGQAELAWFEWTGGASAWLTILALLALAADTNIQSAEARAVYAAYLPWVCLAGTMLDSYGDIAEDATNGDHSYITHYSSTETATHRVAEIVSRSIDETARLGNGHRHLVIVACMIAMYLSKDSTRTPQTRELTRRIARAGGSLTRLLLPALRAWRILNGQRSA